MISFAFGTHPAARNAGLFRTLELTLISRSPTPSFIVERYAVRSWYRTKLPRSAVARGALRCGPTLHFGEGTWWNLGGHSHVKVIRFRPAERREGGIRVTAPRFHGYQLGLDWTLSLATAIIAWVRSEMLANLVSAISPPLSPEPDPPHHEPHWVLRLGIRG